MGQTSATEPRSALPTVSAVLSTAPRPHRWRALKEDFSGAAAHEASSSYALSTIEFDCFQNRRCAADFSLCPQHRLPVSQSVTSPTGLLAISSR